MEKAEVKTYKRRKYFIEKKFQGKFILKFCTLVVLGGLLSIGILYLLAMRSTTVAFVNSRVLVRTTADFILPILLQTTAIVTVLVGLATIIITMRVSHKIAGPLYHFKKAVQDLETGDFSSDFHIRKLDQLHDLADAFNSMVQKTRAELSELKHNLLTLKEKLQGLSENEIPEHKHQSLSELKRISEELNKIIRYFKT